MRTTIGTGDLLGGRYLLGRRIASGGMGDVWSATDEVLAREVAVKLIRETGSTDFRDRFRDEARHSAALQHPNIAAVFDFGEDEGVPYLVMELVPGRPLSSLIATSAGEGLEPEQVRSIVGQAALALAAAHEAGVVHRDVKPANIIVTPDGRAKLTDFGIARAGDGNGHTPTGDLLGTPEYLSPEQALGEPATGASDLYSLGVIAHEMLTGSKPFDAGTPVATAVAQVTEEPPALPGTIPDDLRSVVEACLVKAPEERPADARTVADTLLEHPGRMPLSSLPAPVPSVPSAPSPTRALPVIPAPIVRRADVRRPAQRHTASRRRPVWGWLAVPVLGALVWAAFALGSLLGGSDDGTTAQREPVRPPGAVLSPSAGPSTTAPTSPVTTSAPAQTEPAGATPAQDPPPATRTHPGKGNGRGKGIK